MRSTLPQVVCLCACLNVLLAGLAAVWDSQLPRLCIQLLPKQPYTLCPVHYMHQNVTFEVCVVLG